MQCVDCGIIELEQWLTAGTHHKAPPARVATARPTHGNGVRQCVGCRELTAIGADAHKVRITEFANSGGAIGFATRPQIAPGKAQKNRRASRVKSFTLQGVETLFDRICHGITTV